MTLEERAEFLLERHCPMMLGLPGEIGFDLIQVGVTDGEGALPRLPCEIAPLRDGLVNPLRGMRLDPAEEFGHGDLPAERGQEMDVFRHPAGGDERAPLAPECSANVLKELRQKLVVQGRRPEPSAEDQVMVQTGEGLGHG